MFLGHFGVALAAKRLAPKTSLGTLLLAAQFADLLWPVFLILGWETAQIDPGNTRVTPLNFTSYPISHSLLTQIGFGIGLGLIFYALRRGDSGAGKAAYVLAACVPSHWVLDWIVHRPDLPLTPWTVNYHGLGLWNSLPITLALEFGIYGAGLALYLRQTKAKDAVGRHAFWLLVSSSRVYGWELSSARLLPTQRCSHGAPWPSGSRSRGSRGRIGIEH